MSTVRVLSLLVLIGVLPVAAPHAESEPASFTLSSDPATVVLSIEAQAGGRILHVLELRGNGDLLLSAEGIRSREVSESYRLAIGYQEMVDLVDLVVAAGLVEATAESIETKRCADGCPWTISHPGFVRVSVHLDTYTRDGNMRGDVHHDVGYGVAYAEIHPDIPELQGLSALLERLRAYFEQARGAQ